MCIPLHKLLLNSMILKLYRLNMSKKISYERMTTALEEKRIKEFAAMS